MASGNLHSLAARLRKQQGFPGQESHGTRQPGLECVSLQKERFCSNVGSTRQPDRGCDLSSSVVVFRVFTMMLWEFIIHSVRICSAVLEGLPLTQNTVRLFMPNKAIHHILQTSGETSEGSVPMFWKGQCWSRCTGILSD